MKRPELLSPAGDLEKLKIAVAYGADAVYGGVSHFSLRLRSGKEFTIDTFREGVEYAHARNRKVYVTVNGFPFNSQIDLFRNHIAAMRELKPDAFIVSSPGTALLAKETAPEVPLHLSTQANVMNVLDARVYYDLGVRRIIAAREISLKDLEEIKSALPDLELEVFVHGSMCFAYSGRCLITSLQTGRVANRGSCANDCRFPYKMYVENEETGVLMEIEEDEQGTHIFNAKDLNMLRHLEEIVKSGAVDSVKIEGRTKAPYYCGIVTRSYRKAIDAICSGEPFDPEPLYAELETTKHRGFSDGYLVKRPYEKPGTQEVLTSISEGTLQVAGLVADDGEHFLCKARVAPGDTVEIVLPEGVAAPESVENDIGTVFADGKASYIRFKAIETRAGKPLEAVHSGNTNPIRLPVKLPEYTFLRRSL